MQPHHVPDSAWFYSTAEAVLNLGRFQGWLPNTVTFFRNISIKKELRQYFKMGCNISRFFGNIPRFFGNISRFLTIFQDCLATFHDLLAIFQEVFQNVSRFFCNISRFGFCNISNQTQVQNPGFNTEQKLLDSLSVYQYK